MILTLLCLLVLTINAYSADLPVSKMQNAISGVAQSKMLSNGFLAADPRYNATIRAIGGAAIGYTAEAVAVTSLGITAPAWVSIAAIALAGYAGILALDAGVKWLFKDRNSVQVGDNPQSVNTPAGMPIPTVIWCWQSSVCSGTKAGACTGIPGSTGESQGRTFQRAYNMVGDECHSFWTFSDTGQVYDVGVAGAIIQYTSNRTACPGISLSGTNGICPASNFPEPAAAPVKTLSDAANGLTDAQKAAALNPQIVADLANDFWREAAAAPGYDGLPYDATQPITATQAQAWQQAHTDYWPSVGDFVAPQAAPSGGTASSPFTMPTVTAPVSSADPTTQPSTGTNPSTEPLSNLGPDPGIGAPGLEPIPTAQQIIAPLTNAFPSVKSFVVPNIDAQCPTWQVPVFGKDIDFTNHCALLEQARPTLFAVMAVVYALMALFIVLRA
ncbi:hypothetical protein [Herbaspirillum sp. SJZ099]|uniref:hypothetical protein n=1 Tax=Herbaspirillum sp. SJZ099 TaxID=2572916 RepID=UPI00119CFCD1|nr:hypothetical protein [Herbaspirillum sp. SJZ099]